MNEVLGVCVVLEPPGPNKVRVYSVISPLASRGRCQTTAIEDDDRFLVDTSNGAELGTKVKHTHKCIIVNIKTILAISECVDKLTVIIRPQVHCAGMVVGRAGASGRCNS